MDSFTIELVSNTSFNCCPNIILSSLTNFLPEQKHLKGEWEVAEEKRMIVPMHIEPGLYPSIVDMNNKTRERLGAQAFEYNGIYVSVDKFTQKIAVPLPENESVFIIQSSDLSHIFGWDLEQSQTGVKMKGKGPHYSQHFYDII